jgi:uncharacterized membrane protein YfhO
MDGDQYFGFYGYLQGTFFSNNNLLYSWSKVLGGSMFSTFAYYASSPFNLLLILFKNDLPLGVEIIALIKLLCISVCFCVFLNSCVEGYELEKGVFSTAYAFMGYVVFYVWNVSWLDGVAFLPLLAVGLKRIVLYRKNVLYTVILAIAIISNFYIGYMLCITSLLFYIAYCVLDFSRFKKSIVNYTVSSILAVGISMWLLLPAYLGIPQSRKLNYLSILNDFAYNFKPYEFVSMFYTGAVTLDESASNLPVVFFGIIQFVLVISYFINSKIKCKEKLVAGGLIAVLYFSFQINLINIIWHGFAFNAWYNYRYSFVFSFIMLSIAFRTLTNLPNRKMLAVAEILFVAITLMLFLVESDNVNVLNLIGDILLSLFGVVLISIYCYNELRYKNVFKYCFCMLMMLNIIYNCLYILDDEGEWGIYETSVSEYFAKKETFDELSKYYDSNSIVRIADYDVSGRCEAMLFNYAGTADYASTENTETLEFVRKLGISHAYLWGQYNANVPQSTDDLLGFKYILSKSEITNKELDLLEIYNGTYIYENMDALPLIFATDYLLDNDEAENYFELQNNFFKSFCATEENDMSVFEQARYDISKQNVDGETTVNITVYANTSDAVYMQLPEEDMTVQVDNGLGISEFDRSEYNDIYYIGRPSSEGIITVTLKCTGEIDESYIYIYQQNQKLLSECVELIKTKSDFDLNVISSSHLEFSVNSERDTIYTSTIPYTGYWNVYVDGNETSIFANGGQFLAFSVTAGQHLVKLVYYPRGFKEGILASILSIILLVISIIIKRLYVMKSKKVNVTWV